MTTDELVEVLEELTDGLSARSLLTDDRFDEVGDRTLGVLVRFIGGERPEVAVVFPPNREHLDLYGPPRDPHKPLALGGDFDGVELP